VWFARSSYDRGESCFEFTQVLAGENRIHRESHGKIFRDREGRIRNEIGDETPPGPSVLLTTITIDDPVSQTFITLNPHAATKSAVVNHVMVHTDGTGREVGVGFAANSRAAETRVPAEMLEQLKNLPQAQGAIPAATGQKLTLLTIALRTRCE
jgi:hypothetical protein